ncbi:putative per-hexamer repeat protein 5 isoform X1 [Hoplias malabaricus]|uniref:putative per-hexamer repeat protein 5 isoform X1 n=1 Tax=Hoplias malabaricus TaxID=27720 RepID=UPI00346291E5
MFGSVRKLVSVFETRKKPSLPPAQSSPPLSSSLHPSSSSQSCNKSTDPASNSTDPTSNSQRASPTFASSSLVQTNDPCPARASSTWSRPPSTPPIPRSFWRDGGKGPRGKLRLSWPSGRLQNIEKDFLTRLAAANHRTTVCRQRPPELDRRRLRPVGLTPRPLSFPTVTPDLAYTTSTRGPITSWTTGPKSSSTEHLKSGSIKAPFTMCAIGSKSSSTTGPKSAFATGSFATCTRETKSISTTGPFTSCTTGPFTSCTTRPSSTFTTGHKSISITKAKPTFTTNFLHSSTDSGFSESKSPSLVELPARAPTISCKTGSTTGTQPPLIGSSNSGPGPVYSANCSAGHTAVCTSGNHGHAVKTCSIVVQVTPGIYSSSTTGNSSSSATGTSHSSDTGTSLSSATGTSSSSATGTSSSSATGTSSSCATGTSSSCATGTSLSPATGTSSSSATETSLNSNTGTSLSSATGTSLSSATGTSLSSATGTILSSAKGTSLISATGTSSSSATGTSLSSATETSSNSATGTSLSSATGTSSSSATGTSLIYATGTSSSSSTGTSLSSDTGTSLSSDTGISLSSATGTSLSSATGTSSSSATATSLSSATGTNYHRGVLLSSRGYNKASRILSDVNSRTLDSLSNQKLVQGRGVCVIRKQRLRPSDSALSSLLRFLSSGSSSSMIAIDNKIEQAMDLVKAHLMLAVREEVEVLREQIKELLERNAQLERENYILRALRDPR